MEEKSIWRQRSGRASKHGYPLGTKKVGGGLPGSARLSIGSAADSVDESKREQIVNQLVKLVRAAFGNNKKGHFRY